MTDDVYAHLKRDSKLEPVLEEHGELMLEPAEKPFERLVVSIVNQQLSTQSAAAIKERLFEQFTIEPRPILDAETEPLREVGLSKQKIEYIRNVAERFEENNLSPEAFQSMSNEEVIEELTSIRGVGDWTAKMFLMFVLAREDVFPVEDLGIRNGIEQLYGESTRSEMREVAAAWKPYRSFACLYIWRHYES